MGNILDEAFASVPRDNFLPPDQRAHANWDMPLPIGYGQTNSQPTVVRWMLQWLDAQPGQKVLDVGSGSGWTSALLAHIVGHEGRVIAVEKVPELVELGRKNCHHLGFWNIDFHQAGPVLGWKTGSLYDRILVSAGAGSVPEDLLAQLKPGGRMVIPVQEDILVIQKTMEGRLETETYQGFVFVPLV